ncbi:MAG: hypothetical protein Q7R45_14390 [Sulfuricaulis sp.]|nr:hypothetical protein [Sulfuricaulis sp.]
MAKTKRRGKAPAFKLKRARAKPSPLAAAAKLPNRPVNFLP